MVKTLRRKLARDLTKMVGQVVTIALVVACGVMSFVTMRSTFDSLGKERDRYYASHRFSEIFATLKRAPHSIEASLRAIPGVAELETRIVEAALVPLPSLPRPASGPIVGIDPARVTTMQNRLHFVTGRNLDPSHLDEVLVVLGFAEANHLEPGDSLPVVLDGTSKTFRIAGVVLSPEYVMTMTPGQMTYDPASSPVLWVHEKTLESAFAMKGSFNGVTLISARGADREELLERLDETLRPYGGLGAVGREKQPSNYLLGEELAQLASMANFVPYLFLLVAALLVNIVLSRTIQLERGIIATLKAIGYADRDIALYYLSLAAFIVLLGSTIGIALGALSGNAMMRLYTDQYFRFPDPSYHLAPMTVVFAVATSLGISLAGALLSVRSILRMSPAVAMLPPAPPRYRRSFVERLGLLRLLGPETKMVWREVSRRPFRLAFSVLALSLSIGIVVVARSMGDSMDYLLDVQFHRAMREDLTVTFTKPLAVSALSSLRGIAGVEQVEGLRSVAVRMRSGRLARDSVILGYEPNAHLRLLLNDAATRTPIPDQGITLTRKLAEVLAVGPGDPITLELREGTFRSVETHVAATVNEPFGLQGHATHASLAHLVGDAGAITTALLRIDRSKTSAIEARLKAMPLVQGVGSPHDFRAQFEKQSGKSMAIFSLLMLGFAVVIAVSVVYNGARVSLSQRERELGSLRVLGFTRGEVARILFGEQFLQVLLAIPPGLWIGTLLSRAMFAATDPEAYRIPVVIAEDTYVFAILVAFCATLGSTFLLRRKLDGIDLIGVLKTRE